MVSLIVGGIAASRPPRNTAGDRYLSRRVPRDHPVGRSTETQNARRAVRHGDDEVVDERLMLALGEDHAKVEDTAFLTEVRSRIPALEWKRSGKEYEAMQEGYIPWPEMLSS